MSIKVNIFHAKLLQAMHNPDVVTVDGKTVGECLDDLVRQYPYIETLIFDKQRQLLRQIYVFVNAESLYKMELTKPVKEGDILIIALLITGG